MLLRISLDSYWINSTHVHTVQNKSNYVHVRFVGHGSNYSTHESRLMQRHAEQNNHFSGDNV